MQNITIGFIGAGHMASSLIGGLITAEHPAEKIWASEPLTEKLAELQKKFPGVHFVADNKTVAEQAQVLIFAVKPQILKDVAVELAPIIAAKQPLIISIAAGVREPDLRKWLGEQTAIVRCMPNTPALIQSGATALYANAKVTATQKNIAESILRAVGVTVWMDEEHQLDAVTALSGSGPAYFFLVIEALEQAAIAMGLSAETAHLLTLQTALGSTKMALESNQSAAELRQQVTSPGGTTEQAIQTLEKGNLRTLFAQALAAAEQRAQELGQLFSK